MLKGGAAGVLCCGILCIGEVSSVNMILRLTGVLGGDIIMVGLVGSIGEIGTDAARKATKHGAIHFGVSSRFTTDFIDGIACFGLD